VRIHAPRLRATNEWPTQRSRGRYPPRRKAGVTVSRYERGAFRRDDRTATEIRVRSPSLGNQLKRLMIGFADRNRSVERDSNPRQHDWKPCALPTELSSRLVEMTGVEPAPPGFPGALREPHSLPFVRRNAVTQSAPRQSGLTSLDTWPREGARASNDKARRKKGRAQSLPQVNRTTDATNGHSAGAGARASSFSTPLTSKAISAVPTTNPSAMTAVMLSTRSKPPRPCSTAISETAAPDTRKVRK
jgi:hypothetical protein